MNRVTEDTGTRKTGILVLVLYYSRVHYNSWWLFIYLFILLNLCETVGVEKTFKVYPENDRVKPRGRDTVSGLMYVSFVYFGLVNVNLFSLWFENFSVLFKLFAEGNLFQLAIWVLSSLWLIPRLVHLLCFFPLLSNFCMWYDESCV